MRGDLERFHIRTCVRDALGRHGIVHDRRLRVHLETNAIIAGGTASDVVMADGSSLDAAIQNWISAQRVATTSPPSSRRVGKGDARGLRDNFDQIAKGTIIVE